MKERKRVLKDKAGSSLALGMVDSGESGEDSLAGREWEREEEGRDEHCHLANLLPVVGFYMGRVGLTGASLIHPSVRRSLGFPRKALKIWPTHHHPARQNKDALLRFGVARTQTKELV